ncbi:MAG: FHA domain-containing protein [Panacagrimonas sp.]
MGKLIITDANGINTEHALDAERITIGRLAGNDIILNDKAVSGKHAVIITHGGNSVLEDLDSTNGSMVGGKPVSKHPLADGDSISIGRNTLRYEAGATQNPEHEQTMVLPAGESHEATMVIKPAPAHDSTTVMRAQAAPRAAPKPLLGKLRVLSGGNQGKVMELTKALTTIGKPGVQVAAITRRADGYYIVHVGGASGSKRPHVNGAEIDVQARKLQTGDRIQLAGSEMEFFAAD